MAATRFLPVVVSLVAALILVGAQPLTTLAVQCGGPSNIPGDAFDLVSGKVPSRDDGYAVGVVTEGTMVAASPITWALDVEMQLVFKGDVPERIVLYHTPFDPPVEFLPGHRYFFVLVHRGGQPANIPLGLDMCGPSFEISPSQLSELVHLATPTRIYDPVVAEQARSAVDVIPIVAIALLVGAAGAVFLQRARS